MITLEQRIASFSSLGKVFEIASSGVDNNLGALIDKLKAHNGWFTPENVRFALSNWAMLLSESNIKKWVNSYSLANQSPKSIGIIMAGNIPMVGFHDLLCVLMSGNRAKVKLSSKDNVLMAEVIHTLISIQPEWSSYIQIEDGPMKDFEAVIATGSDNSARYFDYYFGKYPHIIRKNRTSIAILTGKESSNDLQQLGWDIFRYFGLGCRNVTKLYVPDQYDFTMFFDAISVFRFVLENNKYANNYDYNKAVFLLNKTPHLDNGFLLLREDAALFTPAALINYQTYANQQELQEMISTQKEAIQCCLGNQMDFNCLPFGSSQSPDLFQYADGVDTMQFLVGLS
ncbi:MAG: acyl-CoA reductase [Bacteroidia bacterium]|nr:acyl-CoA reductase [Bacteroidia bacterium]